MPDMPETSALRRAVFLDRDGTIIVDEGYLADAAKVRVLPGAIAALRGLRDRGMMLIVISNQSGIARGLITREQHELVDARMQELLAAEGVPLDAAYYCPHGPEDDCACRKPRPGMIEQAIREHAIDPARSIMIGDKLSDVAAGQAAGCITGLLGSGKDAGTPPTAEARPDHGGDDWPSLLSSMETSWKI
jgi:D-glycero-D-manno-heptose 1,7-bisphosphate phosphatase